MKTETFVPTFYGKDCPKGMVQVEFVGCDPKEKTSDYGWKPTKSAFLEIYIDGQRFRIEVGDYHDGHAERRGLYIVGPVDMGCEKHSCNAASIFLPNKR